MAKIKIIQSESQEPDAVECKIVKKEISKSEPVRYELHVEKVEPQQVQAKTVLRKDRADIHLDGAVALEEALAHSLGLDDYRYIMDRSAKVDISIDQDFQRRFNHFYRVRRNKVWRDKYYQIFEESKENKSITFENILRSIYEVDSSVEASFSSKMYATINPAHPIWDSRVLQYLGLKLTGKNNSEKLDNAVRLYGKIVQWYEDYLWTADARMNISVFDRMFPHHRELSDVKKIDYMLWAIGGER
jgi:hypothetical protein